MDKKEREKMVVEATELLLKRANLTKKDIYESAIRRWVNNNLDLLTAAEKRKYKGIIL